MKPPVDRPVPAEGRLALVTGAGGFIGSRLAERLVAAGWQVRAFVRYGAEGNVGGLKALVAAAADRVQVHRGDIMDVESVARATDGVDTVFHLAARISIPYSYEAPRDTFHVNALGTLNVLEAAQQAGIRRLVHTSTSEVFGSAVTLPMAETHRLKGQSPYAASKIAADKLVESYVCAFGLPAVVVRPFNTYGPGQSPRAVIPAVIQQALAGGPVRLGTLTPRRDFTFVDDTVDGMIRAALADGVIGREINLGTGQDIAIGELAERIIALVGQPCEIVAAAERMRPAASEVDRLCSDNRLAGQLLDWRPRVSLEEGLSRTIAWWRGDRERFDWRGYAV
ncbi:NAD dependent epimerase/dehydratase [Stella humosa]|uniref:NAD dependent epimerase/dehydratase n=1 Tax=Stella humosa TaxID=94 RepID=A0A3N1LIB6_9PROT|nr:SDR family NAD(P)-dependent oxidoreductase [Stella humosa]ROP90578.1 NAD dependent epimerase/dehydratase [Stella humosa]BBK29527.1 NAD-dependent dehydratase [Stella humosa]